MYAKFILSISLLICFTNKSQAQDYPQVPYGPEERQFVDIYLAPSDCPTPVFFDAHGNGGTTNMPNSIVNELKAEGISIVAWESLTSVNTQDQVETGWNDAELMFAWVKENADNYNFDTTKFIISGSSRGSILSWKYSHRSDPNIRGLYMYNALPDGIWQDSTWWYPPNEVKVTSPPIFFVYAQEPGVVIDSHDPLNGMIVMDRYDELGIGNRDTLIHSIASTPDPDKYQFLIDFIRVVVPPCTPSSTQQPTAPLANVYAYPNPFNQQFSLAGLKGDEHFMLTTLDGKSIIETNQLQQLIDTKLPKGVFLLTVKTDQAQKLLRIVKQ